MHYTIYKITNILNSKIYIGKHKTTNIDDGYMGSGTVLKRAIQKYGIDNFTKEILFLLDSESDMNLKEKELVTEEFVSRTDTYNTALGGQGGKLHSWSEESRTRLSESLKDREITWGRKISKANTGRTLPEETKHKMSKTRQNRGETKRLNVYKQCCHCGKSMNLGNLARYHNDNCKLKPIAQP